MIAVTGSTGFIGSNLINHLLKEGISFVEFEGDILKINTYPKNDFSIIIHLASLITHSTQWTNEDFYRVNVVGTRNLVNYYSKSKIIYISTTDVEKDNQTYYAKTKKEAESLVLQKKNNLVIRLPSVFGPEQKQDKLIPRLIKHYYYGEECTVTNNNFSEYVFVDDVSKYIINNLDNFGLIRLNGIKISNYMLKDFISAIFSRKDIANLSKEEKFFFNRLKTCCPR
jgi:nucleoside-diphosphate-sugar epimerase